MKYIVLDYRKIIEGYFNNMSNIWFSSDHHFNHKNIIKYCERPFKTVDEMNHRLIENHNKVVGQYDDVYFLGDFSFENSLQYTKRLNGKLHLIKGNHDYKQHVAGSFEWTKDVFLLKSVQPMVFMSHYAHRVWPHSHHGCIHLYGHSHGGIEDHLRSMDVGVDRNNFTPVPFDDIVKIMKNRPFGIHHER